MNRFYSIILLLFLSIGPVKALQLGQITVDSYLNEPLKATLPLNNIDVTLIDDIRVNLADEAAYRLLDLSRPHYLTKLKFEVIPGTDTQHTILITSKERIHEPIMEVLIKVADQQNIVMRLFTMMMDLREFPVAKAVAVRPAISAPPIATQSMDSGTPIANSQDPIAPKILLPKAESSSVKETSTLVDMPSRIQVNNQSLSIIAQDSALHEKYSVYQIMRAFYLLNPDAFWKENINLLHSGASLVVPDAEFVSEVNRQQAVNFVYSVSSDFPHDTVSSIVQPLNSSPGQISSKDKVKKERVQSALQLQPNSDKEFKLSDDIKDDISTWRSMVDELKAITQAINSQNKAIQVQNSVIEEMNSRLESKANDIEQINLRLGALEQVSESVVSTRDIRDVKDDWVAVTQTIDEAQEVSETKPTMADSASVELVNGLQTAVVETGSVKEVNSAPLARQSTMNSDENIPLLTGLTPSLDAPLIIPVPQIIITDTESNGDNGSLILWGSVIAGIVIFVFLLLNRKSTSSVEPVTQKPEPKRDVSIASVSEPASKTSKKAKKGVVTNFDDTYDVLQVPVVTSRSKISFELDNEDNIHAEVDLLVAYQEYEEALNLLSSARKKFADDYWLDIMELKIHAYSKDVDMFFFKREQYRDKLSTEYPDAWKKIMRMSEKLTAETGKTAVL